MPKPGQKMKQMEFEGADEPWGILTLPNGDIGVFLEDRGNCFLIEKPYGIQVEIPKDSIYLKDFNDGSGLVPVLREGASEKFIEDISYQPSQKMYNLVLGGKNA